MATPSPYGSAFISMDNCCCHRPWLFWLRWRLKHPHHHSDPPTPVSLTGQAITWKSWTIILIDPMKLIENKKTYWIRKHENINIKKIKTTNTVFKWNIKFKKSSIKLCLNFDLFFPKVTKTLFTLTVTVNKRNKCRSHHFRSPPNIKAAENIGLTYWLGISLSPIC